MSRNGVYPHGIFSDSDSSTASDSTPDEYFSESQILQLILPSTMYLQLQTRELRINKTIECSYCSIKFGDIYAAKRHFFRQHPGFEAKKFIRISDRHRAEVDEDNNFLNTCTRCVHTGNKNLILAELHAKDHLDDFRYQCSHCEERFKMFDDLNTHMKSFHDRNLKSQTKESVCKIKKKLARDERRSFVHSLNQLNGENLFMLEEPGSSRKNPSIDNLGTSVDNQDSIKPPNVQNELFHVSMQRPPRFILIIRLAAKKMKHPPSKLKTVVIFRHLKSLSKILECFICKYTSMNCDAIIEHMSSHSGKQAFGCKNCSFETNSQRNILQHVVSCRQKLSDIQINFRCIIDAFGECSILKEKEVAYLEAIVQAKNGLQNN